MYLIFIYVLKRIFFLHLLVIGKMIKYSIIRLYTYIFIVMIR
jgi:hypothetical protein